jgi:hypothetical protein
MEDIKKKAKYLDIFKEIESDLMESPFILIIGKYDQILGPNSVYSSTNFNDQDFIKNLLRDALNTKNKFVILNFDNFYSQVFKIDIQDDSARGGKQLYAIILLRHNESPLIPTIHFKRIGMIFHKIRKKDILKDNIHAFQKFYEKIRDIYLDKDEILPLESCNLQIRSGVNTIQGFCELILEDKRINGELNDEMIIDYVKLMLDSCDDIMEAIEENLTSNLK